MQTDGDQREENIVNLGVGQESCWCVEVEKGRKGVLQDVRNVIWMEVHIRMGGRKRHVLVNVVMIFIYGYE